jgi:DNA invertase Pin-like site-specific DNA recombinase
MKQMIIGYLDNSKNNISTEEQQALLNRYASEKSLKIDLVLHGEDIAEALASVQSKNHILLVANVLAWGDSLNQITENIIKFKEREMTIISVSGNIELASDNVTRDFIHGMRFAAEIRSLLTSSTTKRVLQEKRANGQKLGRAFGARNKNTIATKHGEFMRNAHANGMNMAEISRQLNISYRSVFNYFKHQGENNA